jgi:hypothetical protein
MWDAFKSRRNKSDEENKKYEEHWKKQLCHRRYPVADCKQPVLIQED